MLPQSFFGGDTVDVARALVGRYLVRRYGGNVLAPPPTQTEADNGPEGKDPHPHK